MLKGQSPFTGDNFMDWLAPRVRHVAAGYDSPCWIWRLMTTKKGYVRWRLPRQFGGHGGTVGVHRIAYQQLVGPIEDGLVIDHLCRNRNCLNPAHLEPVTAAENTRRGINQFAVRDACGAGHRYMPESSYRDARGHRLCRICQRAHTEKSKNRIRRELGKHCCVCNSLLNETNTSGYCWRCVNARLKDNILRGKFARVRAA